MAQVLMAAGFFLAFTLCYWILQLRSGLLSIRYWVQIVLLAGSVVSGLWLLMGLTHQPLALWVLAALALTALFWLAALALFLFKLLLQPGQRMQSLHTLSRSFAKFDTPSKRLRLQTSDGVSLQVVQLVRRETPEKAVIVCHGGGRSKDIQAIVMTCELLAESYDVITFDWRGHQESDGYWAGDGDSRLDLKAVLDYVRDQGYRRVGVVAWSFGAWSAIVEAAEFHNIDALIAAAPPPSTLRNAKLAQGLFSFGLHWWAWPVRAWLKASRNFRPRDYDHDLSLHSVIADLAPMPWLLVCNEYDTAIGAPVDEFRRLFDLAGEPKEFVVLPGRGHIYDWPNTLRFLNLMMSWLERAL